MLQPRRYNRAAAHPSIIAVKAINQKERAIEVEVKTEASGPAQEKARGSNNNRIYHRFNLSTVGSSWRISRSGPDGQFLSRRSFSVASFAVEICHVLHEVIRKTISTYG